MHTHRRTLAVLTAALALTLLAACGSDKKTAANGSSSSSAATTTSAAAFDEAAAKAEITAVFDLVFNGTKGTKEEKLQQLAEPDKMKDLFFENFDKNAAVAAMTTITMETITFGPDKTTADTVFTLNVNGTPALQHFGGSAVLTNGKWKMTTASFCDITYIGATQPAACTS
jgi:hypothetical protein